MPAPPAQLPAARAPVGLVVGLRDRPTRATGPRAPRLTAGHSWVGPTAGRFYLALGAAALLAAGLSLLWPSTPSYDPWSWLVWGREILHLDLHTTAGPSWKPLPVMVTTVLGVFGRAQPDLWLVVARAGALMAVGMAFRLAWRITRQLIGASEQQGARAGLMLPSLLAGLIAAGSLANSTSFITDNVLGYSEGLAVALALIAVDRLMDGARRQAFVVGFFAALDRPELWFFWVPCGVYLGMKDPGARRLIGSLFVLVPVIWLLPELWGSGHLFRALTRAQHPRPGTAAQTPCPACTEFGKTAWNSLLDRVKVAGIAGALAAAWGLWITRRSWWRRGPIHGSTRGRAWLAAIGCFGLLWWAGIAIETEAGLSGNVRYLMLGTAAMAIAGGVAWAWLAGVVAAFLSRRRREHRGGALPAGVLLSATVFLALPPWIGRNVISLTRTHRSLVYQAHLRQDLAAAVRRSGGARALVRCGSVMTEPYQVPMVAWTLGVPVGHVRAEVGRLASRGWPNVILQTRAHAGSALLPSSAQISRWELAGARFSRLAHTGTFTVFAACQRQPSSSVGVP